MNAIKTLVLPGTDLLNRVMLAIARAQLKRTQNITIMWSFLFGISVVTIPYTFGILTEHLYASGAVYFISVALSDVSVTMVLGMDFVMVVMSTIPVVMLLIFVGHLTLSALLARFLLRYVSKNFFSKRHEYRRLQGIKTV